MWLTNQMLVPIDFRMKNKITMNFNGDHELFGYTHSSENLLLCPTEEKKIKIWNKLKVGKLLLLFLGELSR